MSLKFIREPECQNITGLSRTTRWRLEKAGMFPMRRHMSQSTIGWLSSEIEEWIRSRVDAVQSPATQRKKLGEQTNGEK